MERAVDRGGRVRTWLWLAAFAAAAYYPWALAGFYRTAAPAWIAGAFLAPLLGVAAIHAGAGGTGARLAHLAVAAPPLFTLMGVLLYLMKIEGLDAAVWSGVWAALLVFGLLLVATAPAAGAPPPAMRGYRQLRAAHGVTALFLLLVFLAPHLFNHAAGAWGIDVHRRIMTTLRLLYRQRWLEPAIVAAFFLQILLGILLWRRKAGRRGDLLDTLQTASGAYLGFFILAHVNSVFTLARHFGTETDYAWATAAPAGLLADPWSVRLLPHYALAVFFLVAHLACGARGVLRAHRVRPRRADLAAWTMVALGAALAAEITAAMLGARVV